MESQISLLLAQYSSVTRYKRYKSSVHKTTHHSPVRLPLPPPSPSSLSAHLEPKTGSLQWSLLHSSWVPQWISVVGLLRIAGAAPRHLAGSVCPPPLVPPCWWLVPCSSSQCSSTILQQAQEVFSSVDRPSGWHEVNCYSDRPINIHRIVVCTLHQNVHFEVIPIDFQYFIHQVVFILTVFWLH